MGYTSHGDTYLDNPFFRRYGTLVTRCFPPGGKEDGPIVLTPRLSADLHSHEDGREESDFHIVLEDLKGADVKRAKKTVRFLRKAMIQEEEAQKKGGATPTIRQFKEFKEALKTGSEAMLDENSFYELTVLFVRINMRLLKENFAHIPDSFFPQLPQAISVSRSLRHILGRRGTLISPQERFREIMGKLFSLGKNFIGIILFILSTLTTAKGFSDLIQDDAAVSLIGPGLVGPENEAFRLGLAIFTGLTLSSIILDFKARLFQGMANNGRVVQGIKSAFRRHFIWLPICFLLTGVSIWTNYDGIVLMVTKKDDLSNQWSMIEGKVRTSLGDARRPDPDNPKSLNDLKVMIEQRVTQMVKAFEQVPLDERLGSASSGIAKKGPRYWGKYYVVHGGYEPGKTDVGSQLKRRSRTANNIDRMLRSANIDLASSLQSKMRRHVREFSRQHFAMNDQVLRQIDVLERMLYMDPFSPTSVSNAFKVEAYHINEVMEEIVTPIEAHTVAYKAIVNQISAIANEHIELLKQVDKAGLAKKSTYDIDVSIDIPNLDSLDALKNLSIPTAERRNLAELKNLLFESYGASIGGLILTLILFIAISMDLSDPIFFSTMVARWGRRDRTFLDENTERFVNWEEKFAAELRSFFLRPEIRALLPRISPPRSHVFRNSYNHYIEHLNPKTKARIDQSLGEKFRFWFAGLFQETRIDPVTAYNVRRTTIERYLDERKIHSAELIDHLFPGLIKGFSFGNDTFEKRFHALNDALKAHDALYKSEVANLVTRLGPIFENKEKITARATGSCSPVTGLGWQMRQMRLDDKSRQQINAYSQYAPDLLDLLARRMPVIKEELVTPLQNTLARMPNREAIETALGIREQIDLFEKLEEGGTILLGLSRFQGFQLNEESVSEVIKSMDVKVLTDTFLHHKGESSKIVGVVDGIEEELRRVSQLVVNLVNSQEILIHTLTRLRRTHFGPLQSDLDRIKHIRPAIDRILGLDGMVEELNVIETCLLEVWTTGDGGVPSDGEIGAKEQEKHANQIRKSFRTMLERIEQHQSSDTDQFDLAQHVENLARRMESVKARINDKSMYLLTIDKALILLEEKLGTVAELTENIQKIDQELGQQIASGTTDELVHKRRHFLEINRLFFRTVHLQVESIRMQSSILSQDLDPFEPHTLTLSESLYNRTLKITEFLQMSLDYLIGKRRAVPTITAPNQDESLDVQNLMISKPNHIRCLNVLSKDQKVDLSEIDDDEETSILVKSLRDNCGNVKERIRDIGIREWSLLHNPIPEPAILQRLDERREDVLKVINDVENILCHLEGMLNPDQPDTVLNSELLREMTRESQEMLKELEEILESISVSTLGDRRSNRDQTPDDGGTERRNARDRRTTPRAMVKIPIEIQYGMESTIPGNTYDVNKQALCIETDDAPDLIDGGMQVEFRFLEKSGPTEWFGGSILRTMGQMVIINVDSAHQTEYVMTVRNIALAEHGEESSILDVLPAALQSEAETD
ncbi:MAG: hypothetical protein HQL50_07390 [Magnetococcales bacterium]|nr:hypothetical protein [Magnetococcales bacterium]